MNNIIINEIAMFVAEQYAESVTGVDIINPITQFRNSETLSLVQVLYTIYCDKWLYILFMTVILGLFIFLCKYIPKFIREMNTMKEKQGFKFKNKSVKERLRFLNLVRKSVSDKDFEAVKSLYHLDTVLLPYRNEKGKLSTRQLMVGLLSVYEIRHTVLCFLLFYAITKCHKQFAFIIVVVANTWLVSGSVTNPIIINVIGFILMSLISTYVFIAVLKSKSSGTLITILLNWNKLRKQ